jgi:hypothetical protein
MIPNNNLLKQNYFNNSNIFNKSMPLNQMQMMQMYHAMNHAKKMQQSTYLAKINELEKNRDKLHLDKNELKNAIIRPIRVEKSDVRETEIKFKDLENEMLNKKNLEELWKKRTNEGYKHIIRDEKYQKKQYKKKEDLIVHKVTDLDKKDTEKNYDNKKKDIEVHNGELKSQYTLSKELEYKKKFEYNNRCKTAVKFDPKAHEDLKDDNMEYFKKEQEKEEKNKKKIDDIIQNLLSSSSLTKEERNDLISLQGGEDIIKSKDKIKDKSKNKSKDNSKDNSKINSKDNKKDNKKEKINNKIEFNNKKPSINISYETIKEEDKKINIKIETYKDEDLIDNKVNEKDNNIKKNIHKDNTDNTNNTENKEIVNDKVKDVSINEDLKNKYLMRKKK